MAEHNQQFESYEQWVNKASSWLTRHADYGDSFRVVCFDAKGRHCRIGRDFMLASDENAFPVRWLWPDQIGPLVDEATQIRKALFMTAASCQGGSSTAGAAAAAALGIPVPIDMDSLEKRAIECGFGPDELWPWLAKMRATS